MDKNMSEMRNMTLENIAKAVNGTYVGTDDLKSRVVCGVVIDSRQVEEGYLFVQIGRAHV